MSVLQKTNHLTNEEIEKLYNFDSHSNELDSDMSQKFEKFINFLKKHPIKNKKICLIQPPGVNPDNIKAHVAKAKKYTVYMPYGLLALSGIVSKLCPDWEVVIVDLFLEVVKETVSKGKIDYETILKKIPDDCDLYGVSYMQSAVSAQVLDVIDYLYSKKYFVMCGGVQCSNSDSLELLEREKVKICLKRESEAQIIRFLKIWEDVARGNSKPQHRNIVNVDFVYNHEVISFKEQFEYIIPIDIRTEYNKINVEEYSQYASAGMWSRIAGKSRPFANIMSNRGCRGRCQFCSVSSFMKPGVRSRHPDDVLDEILFLYENKGVRHIEWLDDDLLAEKERSLTLYRKLAALNLDITWSTSHYVVAHSVSDELAQAMVDSGCLMIGFGVETGNDKRMKSLGKKLSKPIIQNAVQIMRKYPQIVLVTTWMFGFPKETFRELLDTFNFAKALKVDWCGNSILQPYPKTIFYNDFKVNGDSRTEGHLNSRSSYFFTVGRDAVNKGLTYDDLFEHVIDFRKVDCDKIATMDELRQFQIFFNVFVNLLGNVNLTDKGNPIKIKRHTDDVLKSYPMDAVSWLVNAKASKMLCLQDDYDHSMKYFEQSLKKSSYWTKFFELYEIEC